MQPGCTVPLPLFPDYRGKVKVINMPLKSMLLIWNLTFSCNVTASG